MNLVFFLKQYILLPSFFCVCLLFNALAVINQLKLRFSWFLRWCPGFESCVRLLCLPQRLIRHVPSRKYIRLYICNPLDKCLQERYIFLSFNGKNQNTFFITHFIDICNLLLVYSWNFRIKSFRVILISITKWNFNQNERFCSSIKLVGIIYAYSKSFVDLIKSFTLLLMNSNSLSPFRNLSMIKVVSATKSADILFPLSRSPKLTWLL